MESTQNLVHAAQVNTASEEGYAGTIVLQPYALSGVDGARFQQSLTEALTHANAVIVDLLWVDSIEKDHIQILFSGMQRAYLLGKLLSFLSIDHATRSTLDCLWEQYREREALTCYEVFTPDFEQFLDRHREDRLPSPF